MAVRGCRRRQGQTPVADTFEKIERQNAQARTVMLRCGRSLRCSQAAGSCGLGIMLGCELDGDEALEGAHACSWAVSGLAAPLPALHRCRASSRGAGAAQLLLPHATRAQEQGLSDIQLVQASRRH